MYCWSHLFTFPYVYFEFDEYHLFWLLSSFFPQKVVYFTFCVCVLAISGGHLPISDRLSSISQSALNVTHVKNKLEVGSAVWRVKRLTQYSPFIFTVCFICCRFNMLTHHLQTSPYNLTVVVLSSTLHIQNHCFLHNKSPSNVRLTWCLLCDCKKDSLWILFYLLSGPCISHRGLQWCHT